MRMFKKRELRGISETRGGGHTRRLLKAAYREASINVTGVKISRAVR
jgi:hypothetical protein